MLCYGALLFFVCVCLVAVCLSHLLMMPHLLLEFAERRRNIIRRELLLELVGISWRFSAAACCLRSPMRESANASSARPPPSRPPRPGAALVGPRR